MHIERLLNNENDIKSDAEHRIYKRFNNKLINLEQVLRNDIIIFDKYKINVDFYESELCFTFSYIILFKKTFNVN